MPNVAVNRDGVLGVVWYDRRDRNDNIGWDVRFAASLDGGMTFPPSVRVSGEGMRFGTDDAWIIEASATSMLAPTLDLSLNTFTFMGGDTSGLVADASGVFHAVWIENSTGLPQVWIAAITVDVDAAVTSRTRPIPAHAGAAGARPATPSSGDARALPVRSRDVTSHVALDVSEPRYDRATNVLTVRVQLSNTSGSTLDGPLLLLPGAIGSELGTAIAYNADTTGPDQTGWVFTAPDSGSLASGAQTVARELSFLLTDLRPFRDGDRFLRGLVSFSWTVLGR